jgi:UPF0716 protein FxsA
MHIGLVLIALAFPLLELAVLIKVGQTIGFWWTVLLLAALAVAGGWIIHRQGLSAAQRWFDAAREGRAPIEPVAESMMLVAAGILLAFPGLLTDIAALALLVPPLRRALARRLLSSMHVEVRGGGPGGQAAHEDWRGAGEPGGRPRRPAEGVVIEGEWERVDEAKPARRPPDRETPST